MNFAAKEINAWVTAILLLAVYGGYLVDMAGAGTVGSAFGLFLRTSFYLVIGLIVVLSVTRLLNRSGREDERDRLIALRGSRNAYFVAMAGLFLAFAIAALGGEAAGRFALPVRDPAAIAMHAAVLAMVVAELTNQASRIISYRRGG